MALCKLGGNTIASGSLDQSIKIWDLTSKSCTHTLVGHTSSVCALCRVTPTLLVSGSGDKTVKVWELPSGTCKATLGGHRGDVLAVCRINSSTVASASGDGDVRIFDLTSNSLIGTLAPPSLLKTIFFAFVDKQEATLFLPKESWLYGVIRGSYRIQGYHPPYKISKHHPGIPQGFGDLTLPGLKRLQACDWWERLPDLFVVVVRHES